MPIIWNSPIHLKPLLTKFLDWNVATHLQPFDPVLPQIHEHTKASPINLTPSLSKRKR